MNIRVFTDLRFATARTPTGVGKHVLQMSRGLAETPGWKVSLLAAADQARDPGVLSFLPVHRLPLPWKAASALWTLTGRPCADRWCGDADWVYCPKNDWIPVGRRRLAVTIHGAHELDPDMPPPRGPWQRLYRWRNRLQYLRMCRRADVVLTVSEFLRQQVIAWFQAAPEKVVVVGNGVEPVYFQAGERERPAGIAPYVVALGGLNYLDGGDRVLAVADELARRQAGIRIVVAGRQHDPRLAAACRANPGVECRGYVPAQELAPLLANAVALCYLTRYETFGLGAAEAMACGTPVITCRCTAVPEVVRDAGIYLDPDNPGAVADAIGALAADAAYRHQQAARGRTQASAYSWDACVRRLRQALAAA
jgi:glycosyltransferase involved in cell wall biosynthesis